eukprot:930328-Amorphochlora_amoeboformis.AAC.1
MNGSRRLRIWPVIRVALLVVGSPRWPVVWSCAGTVGAASTSAVATAAAATSVAASVLELARELILCLGCVEQLSSLGRCGERGATGSRTRCSSDDRAVELISVMLEGPGLGVGSAQEGVGRV